MPSIDRSGRAHATRQQVRVIYAQHKIEEQALNQGTVNRMNSNGSSPGASTIFYYAGAASGTGEELAAVLLANSAPVPPPPLPPTAPTDVTVSDYPLNEDTVFFVLWLAPTGGSPPTLYTITASPGDIVLTSDPANGQFVVFGKSNGIIIGTTYTFVVTATNSAGTSPPSAPSAPITAITFPDPPTAVSAIAGNTEAQVSWDAPVNDGGAPISFYTVILNPETTGPQSTPDNSTTLLVAGLINGTPYTFTVRASNLTRSSLPSDSSPEITPIGPPTPPLNVVATAGPGNAVIEWDAPESTGGEPIVGYIITSNPPGYTEDVNPLPRQITTSPLTSGTSYTFTLVAINFSGFTSPPSAPSNPVIPLSPPGPPTNVVAAPLNSAVSITWDDPVSDGGSPISSYTVTSSPGNIIVLSVQKPTLFQSLINGTSYTFTVYATNQIGDSIPSTPSLPVTPATFPDYPLNPTALAGNGEAQVSWIAPSSDGGSPIINYTVITEPPTTGPQTTPDASTTLLVTGLTNGTSYTFTVYATNIMGNSFISAATQPVTPS